VLFAVYYVEVRQLCEDVKVTVRKLEVPANERRLL